MINRPKISGIGGIPCSCSSTPCRLEQAKRAAGSAVRPLAAPADAGHIEAVNAARNTMPGKADIEAMADAALRALPAPFRAIARCRGQGRRVRHPGATRLGRARRQPWQLSGLYEGRPLSERSVWDAAEMPAIVTLFRQPLLAGMAHHGVDLTISCPRGGPRNRPPLRLLGRHDAPPGGWRRVLSQTEQFQSRAPAPGRSPTWAEMASFQERSAAACADLPAARAPLRK